jgi:nitrogen fixation/metabolism regulation signal transduction histidine kinase
MISLAMTNRFQFGLTMLAGLFLLAALFAIVLYLLTPESPVARGPILLTSFIVILIGSLLAILFVVRWLLRPYHQLVGEAQRASVASEILKSQDEAEFVLETFQSVVAQLQEQRKELEKLSAEARERATSAEKFSERIVASLPSGLLAFDANGLSMVVNAPGRTLLEVERNVLGESYERLLAGHAELASMIGDCLKRGTLYRRAEVEAVSSTGRVRRLGATVAPIELPPEGSPRGALCLLTDITEVTELREQVALKRNLESLGEMSAGLAHEFKNSIATLHGYAQLLESEDLLNEVRNLSSMVTAFLNFARPQPLQMEDVSLNELVKDCATELKLELTVDLDDSIVRADERMLRQAVLNLLRNAAEANHGSEESVIVKLVNNTIEIRDTGPGIPESNLSKIFIPFFTTKPNGHGIGLALAHRIVTEHGGTLTAANCPTGGAVFTIKLPS